MIVNRPVRNFAVVTTFTMIIHSVTYISFAGYGFTWLSANLIQFLICDLLFAYKIPTRLLPPKHQYRYLSNDNS